MKNRIINKLWLIGLIAVLAGFLSGCASSQKFVKLTSSDVSNLVDSRSFVFIANKMNPLRGPERNLITYYDVSVDNDSLSMYLPYFGRVYQGFVNPIYGPLHFDTRDFAYSVKSGKKNSYQVVITPKNDTQVQTMYFDVFDNGTAVLNITGVNMDPITFYGYLQPVDTGSVAQK